MRLQLGDVDLAPLTLARSVVRRLTLPCLCQAGSNMSGRPRRRAYCPRVNSGTNPGDLAERVNSGTNPGDLAKRVNSVTNPGDLVERVGMTSSDSLCSVRVISSPGSGGASQGDPEASSSGAYSGPPSPVDARVLRDLEVMKADHNLDTTVTEGSLAVIRGRYSIPAEYELHVLRPGQRPYSSDAPDMCISMEALEVSLRFPLHPLIEECLRWWRISPSQVAPRVSKMVEDLPQPSSTQLVALPHRVSGRVPRDRMDLGDLRGMPKMSDDKAPSTRTTSPAQEVDVSPVREAPKASSKRPIDAPTEQVDDPARRHKKVKVLTRRHKSRHDKGESRSHSEGKEPAAPSEEPETPAESDEGGASLVHHRPRSMKDLFKTKVHKDAVGYYILQMFDLGYQDPNKEMKARWRGLKNSTKIWNDSSAAEEFERGLLHPQLAQELYTLPSEVLLARAAKEMVLVSSRHLSRRREFSSYSGSYDCRFAQSQHFQMALYDRVHDAGRLITFMDYHISHLQQELDALKSGGGPEAVAKAEERASELEQELEKPKRE
ncbi:hypothetical protein BHM03_00045261 [Ensete ventricosum]|nr:hypothetical protein BHM03_00045261 [Ensete ventricosum]